MAEEEYTGICDICAKPADARVEDCHNITCTASCHRESGDLYHADCLKKFIASGAKGTARHIPKIPYTNFPCPKGKGKGSETPCKGVAAHCKRVIVKAEPKVTVPPQVLLQNERKQKPKPAPANKPAAPPKPAKPKAPPLSDHNRTIRLPPIPVAPKPDPLGRNLNGKPQQYLPPGYVEETQAEAGRGKQAKRAQKRAAKRQEESGSQWDASSANDSTTDTSGIPPLEEVLGPTGSAGSGAASSWNNAAVAGDGDGSVASDGYFITDIDRYHALLAKHMDFSDSDIEYTDDDDDTPNAAESAAPAPWDAQHQQQLPEKEDSSGWQSVGAKGRAVAAPVAALAPASSSSRASQAAQPEDDPAELLRREEELLKAALEASLSEGAGAARVQEVQQEDEFEAALQRAMQESLAAEEAQRQREREQQAALLATFGTRTQPVQQRVVHTPPAGVDDGAAWSAGPAAGAAAISSNAAWGAAASHDAAAAAAWGVSQPSAQQQMAPTYSNPYAAAAPAATTNPYASTPAVVPPAANTTPTSVVYSITQAAYAATPAAYAASATPTPLAATYAAPSAATATAAFQLPPQQQQQPQVPVPWLQPAAASGPAMFQPAGTAVSSLLSHKAAPAAAAAAAAPAATADDDDDLDSLLALLNV